MRAGRYFMCFGRAWPLFAIIFLSIFSLGAAAQDKPIEQQIKDILADRNGEVKKWTFKPTITVVFDSAEGSIFIEDAIEVIHREVPGFPGFLTPVYFDIQSLDEPVSGNTSIGRKSVHIDGQNTYGATVQIRSSTKDTNLVSNVFLYYTNIDRGVLFGVLSSGGYVNSSLRDYAEGITPCFVNILSMEGHIQIASIFIRNDIEAQVMNECLYEELTQSLGLLEDSPGSSIFSYDDQLAPKVDRRFDFLLLRSLYDNSVAPGDKVEKVISIFVESYR